MTNPTEIEAVAEAIAAGEWGILTGVGQAKLRLRAEFAIAALDKARGWQPIETAPREGASVLLFGTQRPHDMITYEGPQVFTGYFDPIDEACCATGSIWTGPFYDPTHWMPLPAPPEGTME